MGLQKTGVRTHMHTHVSDDHGRGDRQSRPVFYRRRHRGQMQLSLGANRVKRARGCLSAEDAASRHQIFSS